jgi:hypothetical protein
LQRNTRQHARKIHDTCEAHRGIMNLSLIVLVVLTGCAGFLRANDMASVKLSFGDGQSCPSNQISVVPTARPAWLHPDPPTQPPPPPPDVAADPERAAVYARVHHPPVVDPYADVPFYEARGCGHDDIYMCPLTPDPGGVTSSPSCQLAPPPSRP